MSRTPRLTPTTRAFTLIELLIVVAIIAILAAIAVPNFLEAQTRAKVSRSRADLRSLATAVESYRVDHNKYPEGTDNPDNYDPRIADFLIDSPVGDLRGGYYGFRTRGAGGLVGGLDFFTLTTPIAYTTTLPTDPFAQQAAEFLTYCYRPEKSKGSGYILTSFGPDTDIFSVEGGGPGKGTTNTDNPLSTAVDTKNPSRLGDINERAVVSFMENASLPSAGRDLDFYGGLAGALEDLAYDPTNGTTSDGDLYRIGPQ